MARKTIRLSIKARDVEGAQFLREHDYIDQINPTPASVAMENLTHSLWDTIEAPASETFGKKTMLLVELSAPFRFVSVPPSLRKKLQHFRQTEQMAPCSVLLVIEEQQPIPTSLT